MQNNQKENLLSSKLIKDYLGNESKSTFNKNEKLVEISSSLAFYLKSFSNIKKLLDYVCLILKHIFDQKLILIIPLNDEGEICHENIKISANLRYSKTELAIRSFFEKFEFSKNFKIKETIDFEKSLKNNFKEYSIESEKILSRGKCRGFVYIFSNSSSDKSILDDQNFNLIINCLAVGLENYWLLKTKKKA